MQTNNFLIHEIPEAVNINTVLFLFMALVFRQTVTSVSETHNSFIICLPKGKAVQSKALTLTYRTACIQ